MDPAAAIIEFGTTTFDPDLATEAGSLTLDHAGVKLEGTWMELGSDSGNVTIDTANIVQGDNNEFVNTFAGARWRSPIRTSMVTGSVRSSHTMTIRHSTLNVRAPHPNYDDNPLCVRSETDIELVEKAKVEVARDEVGGEMF